MKPRDDLRYGQCVEVHFAGFGPGFAHRGNKASGGVVSFTDKTITVRGHYPDSEPHTYTWEELGYIIAYDNEAEWAMNESAD